MRVAVEGFLVLDSCAFAVDLNCLPKRDEVALTGAIAEVVNVGANEFVVLALSAGFLEGVLSIVVSEKSLSSLSARKP